MSSPPLINPNYLSTPTDATLALAAFKRLRLAWQQLSSITIGQEYYPGPTVSSDAEILAYIRAKMVTIWHASCTCKMGKQGEEDAVVDSKMRVFGTEGLRVVDASAFPFLPPGHPQASVYALAEKAAEEILAGLRGGNATL